MFISVSKIHCKRYQIDKQWGIILIFFIKNWLSCISVIKSFPFSIKKIKFYFETFLIHVDGNSGDNQATKGKEEEEFI